MKNKTYKLLSEVKFPITLGSGPDNRLPIRELKKKRTFKKKLMKIGQPNEILYYKTRTKD